MAEPFIGQIMQVGFNYAPVGWLACNGQLISIAQNSAMFALLGTTFGGNGQTTFGIPDARGRAFKGVGQGPGTSNYVWGQMSGTENVTLSSANLPQHTHPAQGIGVTVSAVTTNATAGQPAAGNLLAASTDPGSGGTPQIYVPAAAGQTTVPLGGITVSGNTGIAGSSIPFSILEPYLAVWTIIATSGIFPARP
ncbi:MAG: hypothetical protein A4S16_09630 [Proteobacteria bacterium SG_bin6]|nr:MAG: hypothetical protein A4S16_09630 [Proteobacteria bacterium SG_bin6]